MATQRPTVFVVDNVDLDNPLATRVGLHRALGLNPIAVIVTGRYAHPNRSAPIDRVDIAYSQEVLRRNARRMKGYLSRQGFNTLVYEGLIPKATVVPHKIHVDEARMDLHNDYQNTETDGDFVDALRFLARIKGGFDVVCGGPLTEVAVFLDSPRIQPKLGVLTCQLGRFQDNVTTMAGAGITFNAAADRDATVHVLRDWPGAIYMAPTNVAKQPVVGVDTPRQLRRFGITGELAKVWEVYYRDAHLAERGERIYFYDVHPVLLLAQLRGQLPSPLYGYRTVRITGVGPRGQINVAFGRRSRPGRYVVESVKAEEFRKAVITALS